MSAQKPKFRRLLKDFEAAVRNHAWKGSHMPEDWPGDEEWYKETKEALISYVEEEK